MRSTTLANVEYQRGDTSGDGTVSIVDALCIAQYLAKSRQLDTMNAVNAASPRHDGASGDKITITDALYIAQYKALLRDDCFNLQGDKAGGGSPPAGQLDSDTIVEIGSAFLPPNGSTQIPISVRDIADPDGLGAYDFKVALDPTIIRVDGVQAGQDPFSDPAAYTIDNTNGVVLLNDFYSADQGPTTDITVAYLAVTAIGNPWDATDLDITITTLSDALGDDMPAVDIDGFVCITQ